MLYCDRANLLKLINIFLLIFFFYGCGQDITDIAKSISGKEKYPVAAPRVEAELSSLKAMDKNSARKEALEIAHKDWLKLRTSHCASQISQQNQKDDKKLQDCYEAFDNQRIKFLKQQKIMLLYEASCQGEMPDNIYNITYPQEKGYNRGSPRSVVTASCSPIAAVTFSNDMTEIYDIVSGQLINRIKTLDTKGKSVGYHFFLSPNGRILIASFFMPKTELMMWDVMTGELLRQETINLGNRLLTTDGKYFIYSDRNKIGIYDVVKGDVIWNVEGKRWEPSYMSLSPDEKYLIVVRGQDVECWEVAKSSDEKLFLDIRATQTIKDYSPISSAFTQHNQSFYGATPFSKIVEIRLPDLQEMHRLNFSQFRHLTLRNINKTDILLMEASVSLERMNAFYVDMARKTAQKIVEHTDNYTRMAPLSNGQMILAGSSGLKTLNVPDRNGFAKFGEVMGDVVVENVYLNSAIKDAVKIVNPLPPDCENFQTEAIGVYEGTLPNNRSRRSGEKTAGYTNVNIGPTDKPVKLVLSSYEPVLWRLNVTSNARLSGIYLSGSSDSRVEGVEDVKINYIGGEYAYRDSATTSSRGYLRRKGGRDSSSLSNVVKQKTGCYINNFQGAYRGSMFYVGRVTKSMFEQNDIYKTIDENGNVVYRNY